MAKFFSVVPLTLQPDVKGEDFVKFWLDEYAPLGQRLGWESHLLQGESGEREGQYAVIWEMSSVELRDRVVQSDGQLTEEGKRLLEPDFQILNKKLDTFVTGWPHTGYIELN